MRSALLLFLILLCAAAVWAGDAPNFNVKLGLWEVTTTSSTSGMPPLPPEALANMTPEQQAQMEAHMKQSMSGAPHITTEKTCETKEKLEKDLMFSDKNDECTRTVITSTSSRIEMKVQCSNKGQKTEGTIRMDAITPENVKGTIDMNMSGSAQSMKIKVNLAARWLGPNCGDVK
ncbi:MAG TPA: DUF3617 domain-containing protein [Terriglobales bacterium]|nr:DUF3617 domain-containing protein [Terriglobales bacterium]